MRTISAFLLLVCGFLFFTCLPSWCQGGYVEHAGVLVTGKPMLMGREPWEKRPSYREQGVPCKGWTAMTPSSIIPISPDGKAEFYVYIFSDHRGRSTGRPEVKVTGKKITIIISQQFGGGPYPPVFDASLWSERVTVDNLAKGIYEVYLHSTRVGKISVL